jgi:hypothetical protein
VRWRAELAIAVIPLHASDPVGVYAVIQKVVMAPDEQHPTTVQLWGAFAIATGGFARDGSYTPGWYSAPRKGYLYYSAPAGKEGTCLKEWLDFKRVAGTGEAVGFGGRFTGSGRVRPAEEAPKDPDPYPIQMGVTRLPTNLTDPNFSYTDLVTALRKAAGTK